MFDVQNFCVFVLAAFYVFDCRNFSTAFCLSLLVLLTLTSLLKLTSKTDYWGVLFSPLHCYYIKSKKKLPIARIIFLTPEKICGHKYLCIKSNHLTRTRGNFHFCKIFNLSHLLKVFAGNRYHTIDLSRLVFNTCTNNWEIKLRFWDHLQIYLKHFYFKISLIFAL